MILSIFQAIFNYSLHGFESFWILSNKHANKKNGYIRCKMASAHLIVGGSYTFLTVHLVWANECVLCCVLCVLGITIAAEIPKIKSSEIPGKYF